MALDLGGTNFRVLHVRVVEEMQKLLKMDSKICAIPQEIMLGTGEQVCVFGIYMFVQLISSHPSHGAVIL